MKPVIQIRNLRKQYQGFTLSIPKLDIPMGAITGLIGHNGAGKSTLIRLILNTAVRDEGEICLFGQEIRDNEAILRSRIGFVQDVPRFHGYLKLESFRNLYASFYPRWREDVFQNLVIRYELPLDRRVKALSRGMRMKFALSLALSHEADLLILDEPTSSLDPVFRREFLEDLQGLLLDENKTVIFSTQITSDLERIADYITCLHGGKLVFSDTRSDLREQWGIVKGGSELLDAKYQDLFCALRKTSFSISALTRNRQDAAKALNDLAVVEPATLEDIMVYLVKYDTEFSVSGKDGNSTSADADKITFNLS